jgi:hypothetical protein
LARQAASRIMVAQPMNADDIRRIVADGVALEEASR